jgi:hypothetical protein
VIVAAIGAVAYTAGVYGSISHLRAHPSSEFEPELTAVDAEIQPEG